MSSPRFRPKASVSLGTVLTNPDLIADAAQDPRYQQMQDALLERFKKDLESLLLKEGKGKMRLVTVNNAWSRAKMVKYHIAVDPQFNRQHNIYDGLLASWKGRSHKTLNDTEDVILLYEVDLLGAFSKKRYRMFIFLLIVCILFVSACLGLLEYKRRNFFA